MSRYLFTTLPSNDLGLLTQSLPIARELRNRGHQIAFCSPGKAPVKVLSDAGFDNLLPHQPLYYLISGDIRFSRLSQILLSRHLIRDTAILISFIQHMSRNSTAEIWDIDHFMSLFGMADERFTRVNVDALVDLIGVFAPDAIVDFLNPFACIAARVAQKPLATVIQSDMHPRSQGLIWWKEPTLQLPPSPVPAINRALTKYNLPSIEKTGELLIGDMTLVPGMPETDPLPEKVDVHYIGPLVWQKQQAQLPKWISDFSREQPLIWLYTGNLQYLKGSRTFADSSIVPEACIEALKNQAVHVVITTGHHSLPGRFGPLPSNFRYESFVPGLSMAERSDLLIHHGGYGSCQTGLYTGTPALIIPTYSERESNARRIAAQGAGDFLLPQSDTSGKRKKISAPELRERVLNILSDSAFTINAKRLSEKMKSYNAERKAADLIERLV